MFPRGARPFPGYVSSISGRGEKTGVTLLVHETFLSIQGESTRAGRPCFFLRLSGCNLRCAWCDTRAAWTGGREHRVDDLVALAREAGCPLVEVTGGEPLLQPETPALVTALCDAGFEVLVETNGSRDIGVLDPRSSAIVDVKCPGSGESGAMDPGNLARLRPGDELKFVLGDRADYEFARGILREMARRAGAATGEACSGQFGQDRSQGRFAQSGQPCPPGGEANPAWVRPGCVAHLSPVFGGLDPRELAAWMLADRLDARLGLQWHKYIWGPEATGV